MQYKLRVMEETREEVRHFSPDVKRLVLEAVDRIAENPFLGEPLVEELTGYWKYRANRYRIVYKIVSETKEIYVVLIDERESVYDRLRRMAEGEKTR